MIFYAVIGGIGFLLLVLSFILGELGDTLSGLFDHDVSVDIAGQHLGDIGHPEGQAGPGFMNIRSILAFITGFGAVGFICTSFGWNPFWAALPAAGTGLVMSAISWGVTLVLFKQQASSNYSPVELVGKEAMIVTPIAENGMGEVDVLISGMSHKHVARSSDGLPLNAGDHVRIIEAIGTTVIVSKKG